MVDYAAKIAQARKAGYSDDEIVNYLGKDATLAPKVSQARSAGYKAADIVKHLSGPQKLTAGQHVLGTLANINRSLVIGDELAGAFNTAANALTGKIPLGKNPLETASNIGKDFSKSMAQQRAIEDAYMQRAPLAANFARGTGTAATMLVPAGQATSALANSSRLTNMARGAVAAGTNAAGYALLDRGTVKERLEAGGRAARDPITLGFGAAAGAVAPARKATPKAKISEDVVNLRREGVDLTPGQAMGGFAKNVEDAATSLPIVGGAIQDARAAGLGTFNQAVANQALKPIGKRVPKTVAPGHETVAFVERALGAEYDKLIPSGGVRVDQEFADGLNGLADIVSTLTPQNQRRLDGILKQRVMSRLSTGELDGPMYQRVQSELKREATRFSASGDPDYQAMGEAIKGVSNALQDAAARQNPAFATRKAKIDLGYAEFKRLQGASVAAGAGEDGVFSAAQYTGAVRRGDKSLDKGRYARGDALGQDLAGTASRILPSKVPDSGTATRGAIGVLVGAPATIGAGFATGGPVGALAAGGGIAATVGGLKVASKAYSPQAIAAFNKSLDARISRQEAREVLTELANLAANDPKVAPLYREASARLARLVGATTASEQPQNALLPANSAQ